MLNLLIKKNSVKVFSTLFLALLLSACAATSIKNEDAASIQNVGVISLMGDDLRVYDYGVTIFERRDRKRTTAPDWDIGNTIQQSVSAVIQSQTPYTFVNTNIDRNNFSGAYGNTGDGAWDDLDKDSSLRLNRVSPELAQLGAENNVDTWIVISPRRNNSPVLFRELFVVGIGTVREATLVGRRAALFSSIQVDVVRAADGRVLGSQGQFKWEETPENLWAEANDGSAKGNMITFKNAIAAMLNEQLPVALQDVGLVKSVVAN